MGCKGSRVRIPPSRPVKSRAYSRNAVSPCSFAFGLFPIFGGLYPINGGSGHSSNSVNHTIPPALSQDSQAVILKIPEPIRPAREHLHLRVESFGDPVGFGKSPHAHNGLKP